MFLLRDLVTVKGDFISIMPGFEKKQEIVISIYSLGYKQASRYLRQFVAECALWDDIRVLWSNKFG